MTAFASHNGTPLDVRALRSSEEIGYERQKPNMASAGHLYYLVFQMRFSSINLLSFLKAGSAIMDGSRLR
jgi:hypothetical protein